MEEKTMFAPARRASAEAVAEQYRSVGSIEHVREMLDAQPSVAGIINRERQFVLVNEQLLELLGLDEIEDVLGRRPGEAFACVHSGETEGGCGTAEHCRYCGAVQAVLECQSRGSRVSRECRLTCKDGDGVVAMDLRVTATPCTMRGEEYYILAIADIGIEKRKVALERAFFHDLIGTATTLNLTMDLVDDGTSVVDEEWPMMRKLTLSILDDSLAQRDLAAAERGELTVRSEPIEALGLLEEVAAQLRAESIAGGKTITLRGEVCALNSDERLLRRTLFNMLKNALEAEPQGSDVQAGAELVDGSVRFWAHNAAAMTREVQLGVFQRSFTTKGAGRGLGTYSMRLLGEKYLGGRLWFESSAEDGTTFYISLPAG